MPSEGTLMAGTQISHTTTPDRDFHVVPLHITWIRREGRAMLGLAPNHVAILANVLERDGKPFTLREIVTGTHGRQGRARLSPDATRYALLDLKQRELLDLHGTETFAPGRGRERFWVGRPGKRLIPLLRVATLDT
jgi:hypothetical protein